MTDVPADLRQSHILPPPLTPVRQMAEGQWLQLAAGLMGRAFNRMFGGPLAQPCLPPRCQLDLGTVAPGGCFEPRASWTATMSGQHTVDIDLGDGIKLHID